MVTVAPFGFMGMRNNLTQSSNGNSPLAQLLSNLKTQTNNVALPYVNQMFAPLQAMTNNIISMTLLAAQMLNQMAKEKLTYLSQMANIPQPNATTPTQPPTPTLQPNATANNSTGTR